MERSIDIYTLSNVKWMASEEASAIAHGTGDSRAKMGDYEVREEGMESREE